MPNQITIVGGQKKDGTDEEIKELTINKSQVYSIMGVTGSGKSQLINDIEQLAQKDTVSRRQILIDGIAPQKEFGKYEEKKIIAHLSQNMNFVLDMEVGEFLKLHSESLGAISPGKKAEEVLECANHFAGEKIFTCNNLTKLSGGQSRSLMIADVAVNSDSPIVLIDEVENAGIDRLAALDVLKANQKIILLVTHDPLLGLIGSKRIIMSCGGMDKVLRLTDYEIGIRGELGKVAETMFQIQTKLRNGQHLFLE